MLESSQGTTILGSWGGWIRRSTAPKTFYSACTKERPIEGSQLHDPRPREVPQTSPRPVRLAPGRNPTHNNPTHHYPPHTIAAPLLAASMMPGPPPVQITMCWGYTPRQQRDHRRSTGMYAYTHRHLHTRKHADTRTPPTHSTVPSDGYGKVWTWVSITHEDMHV